MKAHKPDQKCHLTTAIEFKHFDFAKKYKDWIAEHYGKVLFMD